MADSDSKGQIDPRLFEIKDCLYRLSVKAVIVKDKKILLTRETRDDWWSLPGGGIDYGETIEQALVREISEELGLPLSTIKPGHKVLFVELGAVVAGVPRAVLFYSARLLSDDIKPTKYVKAFGWYSPSEMTDLYLSPSVRKGLNELSAIIKQD